MVNPSGDSPCGCLKNFEFVVGNQFCAFHRMNRDRAEKVLSIKGQQMIAAAGCSHFGFQAGEAHEVNSNSGCP